MKTDQVVVEGAELPEGAVMHVYERAVTLHDGVTMWLRRWWEPTPGRRVYLDANRWCALRGGDAHLYARPGGMTHTGHANEWAYRAPHGFDSWEDALHAGRDAEAAEASARARRAAR